MISTPISSRFNLDQKSAVEALKAAQEEQREVLLLLDLRAPVPGRGQPSVHTTASVVPASVEPVLEEVPQNQLLRALAPPKLVDERLHALALGVEQRQLLDHLHNRAEDFRHLRVLVDENQGVRHVSIPQVHDAQPDPLLPALLRDLLLGAGQDFAHGFRHPRRLLHAVEALAGVHKPVTYVQHVRLRIVPQQRHGLHDVAPKGQRLGHKQKLQRVLVGETTAADVLADGEIAEGVRSVRRLGFEFELEEGVEQVQHLCDGRDVLVYVGVVVLQGFQNQVHVLPAHLLLVLLRVFRSVRIRGDFLHPIRDRGRARRGRGSGSASAVLLRQVFHCFMFLLHLPSHFLASERLELARVFYSTNACSRLLAHLTPSDHKPSDLYDRGLQQGLL
mmetsp:Transcript_12529/g.30502  ORF Transcript_12529/g.30502 Transcript_12529/m.30502 type:complete len:390 (-) Transcript_12529:1242-2411(-)